MLRRPKPPAPATCASASATSGETHCTPKSWAGVMDKIAADANKVRSGDYYQQKVLAANGIEDLPLSGAALIKRFDQSRIEFQNRIRGLDLQLR